MKKFFIQIATTLGISILILEILIRVFSLAGHTMPVANVDGDKLYRVGESGYWVRGGFGEIRSHYSFNSSGWNSIVDYGKLDSNQINVAIIGDSYIEGFHTDVEKSIGRCVEKKSNNKIKVHEYGRAGGNIVDHGLLYQSRVKDKYDYVFILITDLDIVEEKPSYIGKGNSVKPPSTLRKIYNLSHLIRYLNINHKISIKVEKLLKRFKKSKKKEKKDIMERINYDALKLLDKDKIVFLYEEDKLNQEAIISLGYKVIRITHNLVPYHTGFDRHWDINGRMNCANTIIEYITK